MARVDDDTRQFDDAAAFVSALRFGQVPGGQPWQRNGDARRWAFRGLSDARYALVPSGSRPSTWRPDSPDGRRIDRWVRIAADATSAKDDPHAAVIDPANWTHAHQIRAEHALAWRFFRMTDTQGLRLPGLMEQLAACLSPFDGRSAAKKLADWAPQPLLPLVALAQHYAVPTRLLDWSRKPLVAAYFAASGCVAKSGPGAPEALAVWALDRGFVNDPRTTGAELVFAPRAGNPNLHLQSGLFTLIRPEVSPEDAVDPDLFDLQKHCAKATALGPEPVLVRLTLKSSEAGRLLTLLRDEFIQATTVYAGFAGAARSVMEHRFRRPR